VIPGPVLDLAHGNGSGNKVLIIEVSTTHHQGTLYVIGGDIQGLDPGPQFDLTDIEVEVGVGVGVRNEDIDTTVDIIEVHHHPHLTVPVQNRDLGLEPHHDGVIEEIRDLTAMKRL
jgi:hypothetical protein